MNILLITFEQHVCLGPVDTSRLLGYAYVTYSQWRSGKRPLKTYTKNHIADIMLLPEDSLNALIKTRIYDHKTTNKVRTRKTSGRGN